MKCKEAKDLILTDYVDKEISTEKEKALREHLLHCEDCRKFAQSVERTVVAPFQGAHKEIIPEDKEKEIWVSIQETIAAQEERTSVIERIRQVLFPRAKIPYPAFVLIGSFIVLFVIFNVLQKQSISIVEQNHNEDIVYLFSLIDEESNPLEETETYGTALEEYFL